jgi:hypothetical protein
MNLAAMALGGLLVVAGVFIGLLLGVAISHDPVEAPKGEKKDDG